MSATVKKKEKEESEKKKKKLDEPASSSSSLDVLTEGLKRSILPQIRKLDGTIANARWMQKEVTDATDRCCLEVERVISTTVGEEEEDPHQRHRRKFLRQLLLKALWAPNYYSFPSIVPCSTAAANRFFRVPQKTRKGGRRQRKPRRAIA